jgi:hypothetical protein
MRVAFGAQFHPRSGFYDVAVFVLFLTLTPIALVVFPSRPCFVWIGMLVCYAFGGVITKTFVIQVLQRCWCMVQRFLFDTFYKILYATNDEGIYPSTNESKPFAC